MVRTLRLMTWNIWEGQGGLPGLGDEIRVRRADIVMLNEVLQRNVFGGGTDQAAELARRAGYPHHAYAATAQTGITGSKGVAVLSRFPIVRTEYHPVLLGGRDMKYGTLQAVVDVDGLLHHVFSTRFNAYNDEENLTGHKAMAAVVRRLPSDAPVFFGGDFNADLHEQPALEFPQDSGLADVAVDRPPLEPCGGTQNSVDRIYFRGPYEVAWCERKCEWADPAQDLSDHPWVLVELRDAVQRSEEELDLGGVLQSAPATACQGPNRVDVFVRNTDDGLSQLTMSEVLGPRAWSWRNHADTAGTLFSDPAVASWGPDRLDVFARGRDGLLCHRWSDGDRWSPGWETLGGTEAIASAPVACSWGPGRLDVFALDGDGMLRQIVFDNGNWTGWIPLRFPFKRELGGAACWGRNRIDVFGRGPHDGLGHAWWDGTAWNYEERRDGGVLASGAGVAAPAPHRLDVFVRNTAGGLSRLQYERRWGSWRHLRGTPASTPAAASSALDRVEVFWRGARDELRHSWFLGRPRS